ncbi:hypothetical protein CR513_01310, partial [Mucuna pruriens]
MRDSKLIPYHAYVTELIEHFNKITFQHVPRGENHMANALATISAMIRVSEGQELTLNGRRQLKSAYCQQIEGEVDGKPWYHEIRRYLKDKEYPEGL